MCMLPCRLLLYNRDMSEKSFVRMSVFPTKEEIVAWESLSRDEQVAQLRVELDEAYNSGVSELSRDEIKDQARARLAVKKNLDEKL